MVLYRGVREVRWRRCATEESGYVVRFLRIPPEWLSTATIVLDADLALGRVAALPVTGVRPARIAAPGTRVGV